MIFCVTLPSMSGQTPRPSVAPLTAVKTFDDVVFFAWDAEGAESKGAEPACHAVSLLIDRHMLDVSAPPPDWGHVIGPLDPGLSEPRGYYNYVYADPGQPEDRFYCGKGIRQRWRSHCDTAAKAARGEAISDRDQKESAKLSRIQRHLIRDPELRPQDLCKVIAAFTGPEAQLQSFAVEQYLIQRVCGVFNLTNLNGGQGQHGSTRWQSRPRRFDGSLPAMAFWRNLLARSDDWISDGFSAHDQAALVLHQLPDHLTATLSAHIGGVAACAQSLQWLGLGITGEGDLSIEANIIGTPVSLQLRFGKKDLACRINLRPGPRRAVGDIPRATFHEFVDHIRKIWPHAGIRHLESHPFLKPFSKDQDGKADVDFSLSDLTSSSTVSRCLLVEGEERLSLPGAVGRVVQRVMSVPPDTTRGV